MTDTKSNAITLILPEYVLDVLAQWTHADAALMEGIGDTSYRQEQRKRRADLADDFVRNVLHLLPALSEETDLATAFELREQVYAEHRAALPK